MLRWSDKLCSLSARPSQDFAGRVRDLRSARARRARIACRQASARLICAFAIGSFGASSSLFAVARVGAQARASDAGTEPWAEVAFDAALSSGTDAGAALPASPAALAGADAGFAPPTSPAAPASAAATPSLPQPIRAAPAEPTIAPRAPSPVPDEVVPVTGSRIARPDPKATGQMVVIGERELQLSGATTLNEALIRLPTVSLSGLHKNNNESGNGLSFVELRNLGVHRTLVLVNGRRVVPSGTRRTEAVDLNNIPLALVERVEILFDGASAIYGSDAIGGVVNVILRDDLEGLRANLTGGISGRGDAEELTGDVSMGKNHERGNLTVSVQGQLRRPVWQDDRGWSRAPVTSPPTFTNGMDRSGGITRIYGSSLVPEGRTGGVFFRPDSATGASFTDFSSTDLDQRYNFAPHQYLAGAQERLTIALLADYDLTDRVRAFVEASHTFRHTQTRLAPQPFAGGTTTFPRGFEVPVSNPFIPDDFRATLEPETSSVALFRRNSELGDRVSDIDANASRVVLGLAGEAPAYQLDWEVYGNYGLSRTQVETQNSLNLARALETANPELCDANALRGCRRGNYFGAGALQPEVVDYIRYRDLERSGYTHFSAGASLSMRPFELWSERVGFAAGALFRREAGYTTPDALVIAGDAASERSERTAGSYRSLEGFLELSLPLLAHLPGIHELRTDLAGRYAHHDTFGSQLTYRAAASYWPIRDLRFRASHATAFRAPGIAQLYGGRTESFEFLADPCSNWASNGELDPQVRDNCMRQGVPAEYSQDASTGSSIRANVGGNRRLQAETAAVLTLGAAATSSFLPRAFGSLWLNVDYYRLRVEDAIGYPSLQAVLDRCYQSPGLSSESCAGIVRAADGSLSLVEGSYRNGTLLATSGIDFGAGYGLPLGALGLPAPIRLQLEWQASRLFYKDDSADGSKIRGAGTISVGAGAQPFWRWNVLASISGQRWSILSTHRLIGSAKVYGVEAGSAPYDSVPHVFYWDLAARHDFGSFALLAGVSNLLDRAPPFFFDGKTNSNPNTYDYIGRFIFARLSYQR